MADPEDEGWWEVRYITMTTGLHTGGGDNDKNYAPPPLVLEAGAASSDLYLVITFRFGGQEVVATTVVYTELTFAVFVQVYLSVFLKSSSLSSSTGAISNKDTEALGVVQQFLGPYGGGGGGKCEGGKASNLRRIGEVGGRGGGATTT